MVKGRRIDKITHLDMVEKTNDTIAYFQDKLDVPKKTCVPYNVSDDDDVPMNIEPPMKERSTPHRILCPSSEDDKIIPTKTLKMAKSRKKLNMDPSSGALPANHGNHKLTEYFPVRRSVRKTKKTVLEERQRDLEKLLRAGIEDGLEVRVFEDKGRGVVASRLFHKGDFVVEYGGDLIDMGEARRREERYAEDHTAGCYMYYFKHNDQQYCVDATCESGRLGRLVNHSRTGNLITRTVMIDQKPRLVLLAKDDIKPGEELTYDYGDRSKESLTHHPWLAY